MPPPCARIVARALKGEIRPVMAWGNRPMLPHVLRQGTHVEPNRSLQARCIELETQGQALAASVFVGFPHADIREAGLSAVVCTDASPRRPSSCATNCWTAPGRRAPTGSTAPTRCNPRSPAPPASNRAPSCCWTIATTRPRAARWTTPRCWPRSCARDWTTWPSTPSMIPTPRNRPPGPAWARRSRSRWAARSRPRAAPAQPAAGGHGPRQAGVRRPVPQPRPDGARHAQRHRADRGDRHGPRRDRRDLRPPGALRRQLPAVGRHRSDAEALRRSRAGCTGARATPTWRRPSSNAPARRHHIGLQPDRVQARAPADLSAGSDVDASRPAVHLPAESR